MEVDKIRNDAFEISMTWSEYDVYKAQPSGIQAMTSLRLPGTSEREQCGNTKPFEGLLSRPDTVRRGGVLKNGSNY